MRSPLPSPPHRTPPNPPEEIARWLDALAVAADPDRRIAAYEAECKAAEHRSRSGAAPARRSRGVAPRPRSRCRTPTHYGQPYLNANGVYVILAALAHELWCRDDFLPVAMHVAAAGEEIHIQAAHGLFLSLSTSVPARPAEFAQLPDDSMQVRERPDY